MEEIKGNKRDLYVRGERRAPVSVFVCRCVSVRVPPKRMKEREREKERDEGTVKGKESKTIGKWTS